MPKKARIFYLDFIRAIAVVSILLTHFNARYLYLNPPAPQKAVITTRVANLYIGDWGVSLFFIISGAALMYVYENKLEIKNFFKKRFLSIYPMFWIAYVVAFLFYEVIGRSILNSGVPKWRIIFSVIGFDGFLMTNGYPTLYMLGEWFLGVIILIYAVFPLIRSLLNKNVIAAWIITLVLYLGSWFVINRYFPGIIACTILFVRLPEFLFGMTFIKYRCKVKWPVALGALVVLIANGILAPTWSSNIQTTYIGIASFLVLVFLSYYLEKRPIVWGSKILSKYSYSIFLVHHVIIGIITNRFDLYSISVAKSYLLFAAICVIIGISAYVLYIVHKYVMNVVVKVIPFLA